MNKVLTYLKKTIAFAIIVSLVFGIVSFSPVRAKAAVTSSGNIARGIDVSKYQGVINWPAVAASGVKFAFLRIGTTLGGMDPTFMYNIQQAQANGIKVGVYIYSYATNVEQATFEAMCTITWLENYGLQLPVVFDIEDKCHSKLDPVTLAAIINTYCILIDSAGYYPMIYTYKNFYQTKIGVSPWDKWMAQYNDSLNTNEGVAFWQYSSSGSVPGINTRVDMDYQYKDYSNLIIPEGFIAHNGGTRFYLNWKMQKGWISYQDKKYLADALGNIQKGWFTDVDGKTYFFDMATGAACTGPTDIMGFKFYFDEQGAQKTGFIDYGQGNKYFDPLANGAMVCGWFAYNGTMHYADESGNQVIGFKNIDGADYFFKEDGSVAMNEPVEVNGVMYNADATGVLIPVPIVPEITDPTSVQDGGTADGQAAVPEYIVDPATGLALETATGNWINQSTGEIVATAADVAKALSAN